MMDSRIGLDFIVENPEYIRKLAAALDTTNITVKKQVFELLSALCVYNEEGHERAMETLEQYKKLKNERYRLSIIVKELDRATVVEYQTALVAFINCIIISTFRLPDRIRLRNEFVGCHLLPVLNNLRKCAEAEPELAVQLDVFDEQCDSDETPSLQGPHGVDLSSPLDVFYSILKQVTETPQEVIFLAILQHLLRIDNRDPISNTVWDTAERLVHRATLLDSRDQASCILRTPSFSDLAAATAVASTSARNIYGSISSPQMPQCCTCGSTLGNRRLSNGGDGTGDSAPIVTTLHGSGTGMVPPPPPLPPISSSLLLALPPPPPPPPGGHSQHPYQFQDNLSLSHNPTVGVTTTHHQVHQHTTITGVQDIPGEGLGNNQGLRRHPQQQFEQVHIQQLYAQQQPVIKLPQQEIPQPKIKMKTFNWNKIPSNKVVGKDCIWQQVACSHQQSPMAEMDWTEMEGLFCQQTATPSAHSSPKLGNRSDPNSSIDTLDRRLRKDNSEITLLDGKRSLNVNIFLKQFRSSNEDIVQLIKNGVHDDIGTEKLKGLLKILPEVDELDMLKLFNGDFNKLGNAEKFIIQLTNLPKYKLRIESMLLKEEFAANRSYLEPSINSMIIAAQDLMTSKPLKEVLYMILVAGNFLNSGGYAGDAAGVKLSSLQKITDIRANKPNMNLIHFVAIQAEKRNKELLTFTDNISVLEDAAKTTVEQLGNEIIALDVRIKKIRKEIDNPSTETDIKQQMTDFLLVAEREVANLQRVMVHLEDVRRRLAEFFCDDIITFKLEECFRVFHGFYCKWRQAVAENERRRTHEEQAVIRRRQREELLATKRRQMDSMGTPASDSHYMDTQIFDGKTGFPIKKGKRNPSGGNLTSEEEMSIAGSPSMTRRRLGSFNGGQNSDSGVGTALDKTTPLNGKDDRSPDITPNGSLRRRRSRVLSEEDEGNLMEFLRASGHDNNRERKAWGSLDRSWARRARGVSSRKRPALLTPDASGCASIGADTCVPIYQGECASSPRAIFIGDTTPTTPTNAGTSGLGNTVASTAGQYGNASSGEGTRSKEWRQKIESWLKANENGSGCVAGACALGVCGDRDHSFIDRKNRRSLELDSESDRSNTLDTLPEGKQVYSDSQTSYRRSYPDWKPSHAIDNTDVVSAMETVEEVQAPYVKDKSAWRKSNLNVANSTETTRPRDSLHQLYSYSNLQPNNSPIATSSVNSISENEQRKELISTLGQRPITDRLTVYIRRPSNELYTTAFDATSEAVISAPPTEELEQLMEKAVRPLSMPPDSPPVMETDGISNKDIDQDNIETPPATRRIFIPTPTEKREPIQPSPCKRMMNRANAVSSATLSVTTNIMQTEQDGHGTSPALGDGQFDRFSATRRTRRFKRNTDTIDTITPTKMANDSGLSITLGTDITCAVAQKNTSLSQGIHTHTKEAPTNFELPSIVSTAQEPIKRPRKNNVSYTSSGSDVMKVNNNVDCKENSESINNDEGFEETQSLQSEESPSQGDTSASGLAGSRSEKLTVTTELTKTNIGNDAALTRKQHLNGGLTTEKSQPQTHIQLSSRFNRNNHVRKTTQEQSSRKPVLPLSSSPTVSVGTTVRRTNSLRRPTSVSEGTAATLGVQIPRRSINAGASVNGVNNSIRSVSKNTSTGTTGTMITAPRRSILKPVSSINRTTINTAHLLRPLNATRSTVPTLGLLNTSSSTTASIQQSNVIGKISSSVREGTNVTSSRQHSVRSNGLSFMKPTASSTTKTTTATVMPNRLHSSFKLKY